VDQKSVLVDAEAVHVTGGEARHGRYVDILYCEKVIFR
jgi:hypothetical protein